MTEQLQVMALQVEALNDASGTTLDLSTGQARLSRPSPG